MKSKRKKKEMREGKQWHYTRMIETSLNILLTLNRIWQLWMLLLKLWRWRTTLNCKIPSSPDTLRMLLVGFAFYASESGFSCLSDLAWPSIFLQPKRTFFNYLHHHHHHHVMPLARISLTLSRHFSLSFIASGRSSGLHPVSLHSCCMYVRAGRRAFARSYVGVHRSTSLMSSSLLL